MTDCKTCAHCTVLYQREREDKFSNTYKPIGFILCAKPAYKGRSYMRRERLDDCPDFARRDKSTK